LDLKFFIHTFGCQMNQYDSELVSGILETAGFLRADSYQKSDICLVNSCSVRELAAQKARSELGLYAMHKRQSKKKIYYGILGCLAEQEGKNFLKKFPDVDLVVGPAFERQLEELIKKVLAGEGPVIKTGTGEGNWEVDGLIKRESRTKAWITVSKGCNSFCSYCVVPSVRGREESRPFLDILKEVEKLVKNGYKEINLLGQNVNTYGRELKEKTKDIAALLWEIDALPGEFWVRFWTSHPKDIPDRLVQTVAECKKICPQFHLPVQSGSDPVLKVMNRKYTVSQYLEIIEKIRKNIPGAAVSTDFIVGFPGETEKDFNASLELYRKVRFDTAYTYKYSPRKGTKAFELEDKVSKGEKEERLKALMSLQKEIGREINNGFIGTIREVMMDSPELTGASGRDRTNRPFLVEGLKSYKEGEVHRVKVTGATAFSLKGTAETNSKHEIQNSKQN